MNEASCCRLVGSLPGNQPQQQQQQILLDQYILRFGQCAQLGVVQFQIIIIMRLLLLILVVLFCLIIIIVIITCEINGTELCYESAREIICHHHQHRHPFYYSNATQNHHRSLIVIRKCILAIASGVVDQFDCSVLEKESDEDDHVDYSFKCNAMQLKITKDHQSTPVSIVRRN